MMPRHRLLFYLSLLFMLHFPAYHPCLWEVDISSCLNQAAGVFYIVTLHSTDQCTPALQQCKRLRQGHPDKHNTAGVIGELQLRLVSYAA